MRRCLITLAFIVLVISDAFAVCGGASPTWTAASPGSMDLSDCLTAAADGDTILIPSGTATWSTQVTTAKAVTLQGNGIGNTIIQDGMATDIPMLIMTLVANKTSRITGIEVNNNGRPLGAAGTFRFDGFTGSATDTRRFRFDHNKLDHLNGVGVRSNKAYGVIDNNTVLQNGNKTTFYIYNVTDNAFGDARWAEASNFGDANAVFIETNSIIYDAATTTFADAMDAYGGARVVFRYNNPVTCAFVEAHGTESAGRTRGTRMLEVYNNTFDATGCGWMSTLVGERSGSAIVHHNTGLNFNAANSLNAINLTSQRSDLNFFPWGIADGRNPWDNNVGTIIANQNVSSAGSLTVSVSTPTFTPNALIGMIIRKITPPPINVPITSVITGSPGQFSTSPVAHTLLVGDTVYVEGLLGNTPHVMGQCTVNTVPTTTSVTLKDNNGAVINVTGAGSGGFISLTKRVSATANGSALITGNTNTTITYTASFHGVTDLAFSAGDTFEVNQAMEFMDQPGMSGGTNLNGAATPTWPTTYNQVVDPIYEWSNTINGNPVTVAVGSIYSLMIVNGTHYFTDHRCLPGAGPGGCYIPYTYPHPLVTGGVPPTPHRIIPGMNLKTGQLESDVQMVQR